MTSDLNALLVAALPMVACWLWVRRLTALHPCERAALAIGFGLAIPAAVFFLWRLAGLGVRHFGWLDSLLWLGLAAAALARRPQSTPSSPEEAPAPASASAIAVWAVLCLAIAWFAIVNLRNAPYGGWDAWAIWNLRAGFLAAPDAQWLGAFDPALAWSHPDYPLLVPAAIARAWLIAGTRTIAVPAAVALAFTAATGLLLAGALRRSLGVHRTQAAVAALMTPMFVAFGASQCADVPLGFFALATVILLTHDRAHNGVPLMVAGACAGCAAWTKNEGLVVAIVLPALYLWQRWRRDGRTAAASAAGDLVIGFAPMFLVLAAFKLLLAPPNDLIPAILSSHTAAMRLADTTRIGFVARFMTEQGFAWGGWPVPFPMPLILLIGIAARVRRTSGGTIAATAAGWTLLIQLAVFFTVYVFTPHSVAWHLTTSWDRLVAQMWPMLVWWAFAPGIRDWPKGDHEGHEENENARRR